MLQQRMDGREFMEWMAYYNLEPFGDDWQQAAKIAAASMQPWCKQTIDPNSLIPGRQKKRQQRTYSDAEILAGYQQLKAIQEAKQNGNSRRS